jgi:hypothetical protein
LLLVEWLRGSALGVPENEGATFRLLFALLAKSVLDVKPEESIQLGVGLVNDLLDEVH